MAAKKKKQNPSEIREEGTPSGIAGAEKSMIELEESGAEAGEQSEDNIEAVLASGSDAPISAEQTEEAIESSINLDANLSIQNVVKLHEKLKKAYAAFNTIEIDASHVASIDTATLQLFAALKKDAAKQNKSVEFFQPSARFVESARLLDLVDTLDIIDI